MQVDMELMKYSERIQKHVEGKIQLQAVSSGSKLTQIRYPGPWSLV